MRQKPKRKKQISVPARAMGNLFKVIKHNRMKREGRAAVRGHHRQVIDTGHGLLHCTKGYIFA